MQVNMANDDNIVIDFVSCLLSKGFIVKLQEDFERGIRQETMFRKRNGSVFAKGRTCLPKPIVDDDGWEIEPLQFQDWWVDIIVDGFLTKISVIRYDTDEYEVWCAVKGFAFNTYYQPPSSLTSCKVRPKQEFSLKELAILTLRDAVGFKGIVALEYMLDKETVKTAKASVEWWISL